jgi:hypothetical protein
LATEKAIRSAAVSRVVELEKEKAKKGELDVRYLTEVLFLMALVMGMCAYMIVRARWNTDRILLRLPLPSEDAKELVDSVGAEFEAQAEAHEAALSNLRSLAWEEKARADRLFEEILCLRRQLVDADETIAAMNGGKAPEPQVPVDQSVPPADLAIAPGADRRRTGRK